MASIYRKLLSLFLCAAMLCTFTGCSLAGDHDGHDHAQNPEMEDSPSIVSIQNDTIPWPTARAL